MRLIASIKTVSTHPANELYEVLTNILAPFDIYLTYYIQTWNYLDKIRLTNVESFLPTLEKVIERHIVDDEVKMERKIQTNGKITIDFHCTEKLFQSSSYANTKYMMMKYKDTKIMFDNTIRGVFK